MSGEEPYDNVLVWQTLHVVRNIYMIFTYRINTAKVGPLSESEGYAHLYALFSPYADSLLACIN